MNNIPKKVHFIGICGVATSALAIAMKESGIEITGSDKGFFPPVSTELERHNVDFYAGWHVDKMLEKGKPDLIVYGTASGSENPETLYAKENNIPVLSFAQALGQYFVKENSLVCAGTWGKSSSSALLSFILEYAKLDPTYMFGGISLSHTSSAKLTSSKWSVFEGDEYKSSPNDNTAKFFYYKPSHVLLSAVSWDHADLYPKESDYFEAFKKLLATLHSDGFVVACSDNAGVKKVLESYTGKIFFYGKYNEKNKVNYAYKDVMASKDGLTFEIICENKSYKIKSPMLGDFQAENITGCFAMANLIGIKPEIIVEAISNFHGMKRRMEKRYDGDITVIDDIAHSAEKAHAALETLRNIYEGKIIAIFEPNSGGRAWESKEKYSGAFSKADKVYIPRLTKLKIAHDDSKRPMEGQDLYEEIAKSHKAVVYEEDDNKLIQTILGEVKKGDVIVFLGSHGFRGMIEEIVTSLHRQHQS